VRRMQTDSAVAVASSVWIPLSPWHRPSGFHGSVTVVVVVVVAMGSNVLSPPVARMDSSSNSCFARGKTKKSVNDAVSARQNDLQCATFCEFW
jgi:hypothetical protein